MNERTTMYKNNSRFSNKFEGWSPLQLSINLTGKKPAIGYYSYTNLVPHLKKAHAQTGTFNCPILSADISHAKEASNDVGNPFFRVLQILEHLK